MEANDFLKQFYNDEIVDIAHERVTNQLNNSIQASDIFFEKLEEKFKNDEDVLTFIDYIKKERKNEMYHEMLFSFIYGTEYAVKNCVGSIDTVQNDLKCDYCKNKDFAFMIKFSDNDFGLYIENAAQKYCDEYNNLLWQIDSYHDCELMRESYIKDLEYMEKPEIIMELMKSLFIGAYMDNSADRLYRNFKNGDKSFNMEDRLTKSKDLCNYLHLNELNRYHIGKYEDISKVGLEEYKHMQNEETIKNEDFDKYWLNGEVLIVKMVNGRLKCFVK